MWYCDVKTISRYIKIIEYFLCFSHFQKFKLACIMIVVNNKLLTSFYWSSLFWSFMNAKISVISRTIAPGFIKNIAWYIKFLPNLVFILIIMSFLPYIIFMMPAICYGFGWYSNFFCIAWQTFLLLDGAEQHKFWASIT